jgi:hypothetical protein
VLEVSILVQRATRGATRMSASRRGNGGDDSKGHRALRGVRGALSGRSRPSVLTLRWVFAAAGVAGAVALVAATFATVIEIEVGTTSKLASEQTVFSGWDRHWAALLLLAVFALVMLAGALRESRPAMIAVVITGVCALLIALVWDLPDVHDTGAIGDLYSDAHASPRSGYYLETAGGALLLLSGGGLLLLQGREPASERAPRRRPTVGDPA